MALRTSGAVVAFRTSAKTLNPKPFADKAGESDLKRLAVNGFASHPCAVSDVAALDHESLDDPVELATLESRARGTRGKGARGTETFYT
jgi:hypothetical protein